MTRNNAEISSSSGVICGVKRESKPTNNKMPVSLMYSHSRKSRFISELIVLCWFVPYNFVIITNVSNIIIPPLLLLAGKTECESMTKDFKKCQISISSDLSC